MDSKIKTPVSPKPSLGARRFSDRFERRSAPRLEQAGILLGFELAQVGDGDRERAGLGGLFWKRRRCQSLRAARIDSPHFEGNGSRIVAGDPDEVQERPATRQRFNRLPGGMLQRVRGERASMATAPRLGSGVIQGEERRESILTRIAW